MKDSSIVTSSVQESEYQTATPRSGRKLVQIAIAFATVFCPLVLVGTLLCLFVTLPTWTVENIAETNSDLPVTLLDDSVLWTQILSNDVTLTSSFASNIAQFAASPFLLLFSFLVALEVAKRHQDMDPAATKLLQSDQKFWTVLQIWRNRRTQRGYGTTIAGIGALVSLCLTFLLTVGDKILQGTIEQQPQRFFSPNYVDSTTNGSFKLSQENCPPPQMIPDLYNSTVPPCSIDNTTGEWTFFDAPTVYRVLATGLLDQTGDYHNEDFSALWKADAAGTFDWRQLITHIEDGTKRQHVFYFNPIWAQEYSDKHPPSKRNLVNDEYTRFGYDYIADTTSIVTECLPITTTTCNMSNTTSNNSVPYHCSDMFHGDLNEIPNNGLERLKGWNTSFYNIKNGGPQPVSIASQSNPFSFNVTATVDSIDIRSLTNFNETGDPQVHEGTIVGSGGHRVSFGLSCTSTVYDVRYSLVWGNVKLFNTTLAEPSIAAIIKAPVQAGLGSYSLFEKAAMSVLLSNVTVMDSMELAFSQTFLALAAGVFDRAPNVLQRERAELMLTKIGRGPFYFLVIGMFFYALVVLVFAVIALSIFWRDDVREVHKELVPEE